MVTFDPRGLEAVQHPGTDGTGNADIPLLPPSGAWTVGLYRVALSLPANRALSTTFVVADGAPHLLEVQQQIWATASPWCAFHIVAFGLPANLPVDLDISLTGLAGSRTFHTTTTDSGSLSYFIWPEQFGFPFFSAGPYRISLPAQRLSTYVTVFEHPVASSIVIDGPALPTSDTPVAFTDYNPGRYIWGPFATLAGTQEGEFLVSPAASHGPMHTAIGFGQLPAGVHLIASPYDLGEASFVALESTPTSTSTPTVTATPTFSPSPTLTSTPIVPSVLQRRAPCRKHAKRQHGLCVCVKGYKRIRGRCRKRH